AARRLAALIENLLEVSRLIVGQLELEVSETDLAEAVRGVVERMQPEIQSAMSPITVQANTPVVGRWDRHRVEEIGFHLLSNAIKYGMGKPIEIVVYGDAREARISVKDHGPGISVEDQKRISERFARAMPVRHYGGFGLGLWIVRRLVDAHR